MSEREREREKEKEQERKKEWGRNIWASADHSWASHIIACIGQWVAPPLPIFYMRFVNQ